MEEKKHFETYHTRLGHHLFPGNDYYSMESQTYFSEAWNAYGKDLDNLDEFIHHIKHFTPAVVKYAIDNPSWDTESVLQRWEITKHQIIEKVRADLTEAMSWK